MSQMIAALLRQAANRLSATSPTPRLDTELLLAYVLGWPRSRLLAEPGYTLRPEEVTAFAALIERRVALEPIAYLTGHKEFYGLDLIVTPATLVPRPETELLVELVLEEARRMLSDRVGAAVRSPFSIADLGTGTGAIAIAVAANLPEAELYATDLSSAALSVAVRNIERHKLNRRVHLLQGDLAAPLPAPMDLIVSNPPYTILAEVEPNVLAHEPRLALDGGPDGAAIYRRLLATIDRHLWPGGAVLLEIGSWQGALVAELLQAALPEAEVTVHRDLAGLDRVVRARATHRSS